MSQVNPFSKRAGPIVRVLCLWQGEPPKGANPHLWKHRGTLEFRIRRKTHTIEVYDGMGLFSHCYPSLVAAAKDIGVPRSNLAPHWGKTIRALLQMPLHDKGIPAISLSAYHGINEIEAKHEKPPLSDCERTLWFILGCPTGETKQALVPLVKTLARNARNGRTANVLKTWKAIARVLRRKPQHAQNTPSLPPETLPPKERTPGAEELLKTWKAMEKVPCHPHMLTEGERKAILARLRANLRTVLGYEPTVELLPEGLRSPDGQVCAMAKVMPAYLSPDEVIVQLAIRGTFVPPTA